MQSHLWYSQRTLVFPRVTQREVCKTGIHCTSSQSQKHFTLSVHALFQQTLHSVHFHFQTFVIIQNALSGCYIERNILHLFKSFESTDFCLKVKPFLVNVEVCLLNFCYLVIKVLLKIIFFKKIFIWISFKTHGSCRTVRQKVLSLPH